MSYTILLTVDYHDQNCVIRRSVIKTGKEELFKIATTKEEILRVVAELKPGRPEREGDLAPGKHHRLGPGQRSAGGKGPVRAG